MRNRVVIFISVLALSVQLVSPVCYAGAGVGILDPPGTEQAILSGQAAAASLGLSVGSVCLVGAAAYGIYVAYDNRDAICAEIKKEVDQFALAYGMANDAVKSWWDKACTGVIDTSSKVWDAFKDWATSLYKSDAYSPGVGFVSSCPFGLISSSNFLSSYPYTDFAATGALYGLAFVSDYESTGGSVSSWNIHVSYVSSQPFSYHFSSSMDIPASQVTDSSGRVFYLYSLWSLTRYTFDSISSDPYVYPLPVIYSHSLFNSDLFYKTIADGLAGSALDFSTCGPVSGIYDDVNKDLYAGYDVKGDVNLHDLANDNGATYDTGADVYSGSDAAIGKAVDDIKSGALSWSDAMSKIGAVPYVGSQVQVLDDAGQVVTDADGKPVTKEQDVAVSDTGVTDTVITDTPSTPAPDIGAAGDYKIQLRDFFPFCIPFDIYDMISALSAPPEAPHFTWVISVPRIGDYSIDVDLSAFNTVAALLRDLEILLFCVGLAFATKRLILNGGAG